MCHLCSNDSHTLIVRTKVGRLKIPSWNLVKLAQFACDFSLCLLWLLTLLVWVTVPGQLTYLNLLLSQERHLPTFWPRLFAIIVSINLLQIVPNCFQILAVSISPRNLSEVRSFALNGRKIAAWKRVPSGRSIRWTPPCRQTFSQSRSFANHKLSKTVPFQSLNFRVWSTYEALMKLFQAPGQRPRGHTIGTALDELLEVLT